VLYAKTGAKTPPFLAGAAAYRFLPPFFFPPLADFFAIALYPPLHSWDLREEPLPHRTAPASRHVSVRLSAPVASLLTPARESREVSI